MADTMKVFCPHCLNEFDVDVDAGEEVLNPTATITKHSSMRASWSDIVAEIRSGHGYRVLGQDDIVTFTLKNGENVVVSGTLAQVAEKVNALTKTINPGEDLATIGNYTVTWAWAFDGVNDVADTILGDLAAGKTDIQKGSSPISESDYSTKVEFKISITVTQID